MNCDSYLSMLATLPVDELAYGGARDHAVSCHDCDRITRVVTERERNMVMAFGDLYPSVPVGELATRALATSRRRTVALYYRIGLGVAMAATVLYMIMSRRAPAPSPTTQRERLALQCLSPEQAAAVLRQPAGASGRVAIRIHPSSSLGVIDVEGLPEEMVAVRSLLDRYDNPMQSRCAVQVVVPNVVKVP
jgi:hypothetical protein